MPVINQPPKYDVCKYYVDHLNEIIADFGLSYMFVHAEEEVYARLAHIIWKDTRKSTRILLFLSVVSINLESVDIQTTWLFRLQ